MILAICRSRCRISIRHHQLFPPVCIIPVSYTHLLYYGQDVQEESAENFAQEIEDLYPDVDVDVHSGGRCV